MAYSTGNSFTNINTEFTGQWEDVSQYFNVIINLQFVRIGSTLLNNSTGTVTETLHIDWSTDPEGTNNIKTVTDTFRSLTSVANVSLTLGADKLYKYDMSARYFRIRYTNLIERAFNTVAYNVLTTTYKNARDTDYYINKLTPLAGWKPVDNSINALNVILPKDTTQADGFSVVCTLADKASNVLESQVVEATLPQGKLTCVPDGISIQNSSILVTPVNSDGISVNNYLSLADGKGNSVGLLANRLDVSANGLNLAIKDPVNVILSPNKFFDITLGLSTAAFYTSPGKIDVSGVSLYNISLFNPTERTQWARLYDISTTVINNVNNSIGTESVSVPGTAGKLSVLTLVPSPVPFISFNNQIPTFISKTDIPVGSKATGTASYNISKRPDIINLESVTIVAQTISYAIQNIIAANSPGTTPFTTLTFDQIWSNKQDFDLNIGGDFPIGSSVTLTYVYKSDYYKINDTVLDNTQFDVNTRIGYITLTNGIPRIENQISNYTDIQMIGSSNTTQSGTIFYTQNQTNDNIFYEGDMVMFHFTIKAIKGYVSTIFKEDTIYYVKYRNDFSFKLASSLEVSMSGTPTEDIFLNEPSYVYEMHIVARAIRMKPTGGSIWTLDLDNPNPSDTTLKVGDKVFIGGKIQAGSNYKNGTIYTVKTRINNTTVDLGVIVNSSTTSTHIFYKITGALNNLYGLQNYIIPMFLNNLSVIDNGNDYSNSIQNIETYVFVNVGIEPRNFNNGVSSVSVIPSVDKVKFNTYFRPILGSYINVPLNQGSITDNNGQYTLSINTGTSDTDTTCATVNFILSSLPSQLNIVITALFLDKTYQTTPLSFHQLFDGDIVCFDENQRLPLTICPNRLMFILYYSETQFYLRFNTTTIIASNGGQPGLFTGTYKFKLVAKSIYVRCTTVGSGITPDSWTSCIGNRGTNPDAAVFVTDHNLSPGCVIFNMFENGAFTEYIVDTVPTTSTFTLRTVSNQPVILGLNSTYFYKLRNPNGTIDTVMSPGFDQLVGHYSYNINNTPSVNDYLLFIRDTKISKAGSLGSNYGLTTNTTPTKSFVKFTAYNNTLPTNVYDNIIQFAVTPSTRTVTVSTTTTVTKVIPNYTLANSNVLLNEPVPPYETRDLTFKQGLPIKTGAYFRCSPTAAYDSSAAPTTTGTPGMFINGTYQ